MTRVAPVMPGAAGVVTADVELGRLVAYATARFREAEPGRFVRRAEELQVLVRAGKVAVLHRQAPAR